MGEPSAVFPAIICQNGFYLQSMLLIEGEYVVMKDECRMIGQLARVQVTECKGTIGIDDCLHVDFSHFLEFARIEGVLTKQVAGSFALHMPFLEAGVGFFDGFDLLFAQLLSLDEVLGFLLQEPLVETPPSMAFHDFLDRWLRAVFAFQFQELFDISAAFLRIFFNEFQDSFFDFGNGRLRVGL